MNNLEIYRRETQEIINRFLDHRLTFSECIGGLDAALADVTQRVSQEQTISLRILIAANNEIVTKEMERRENLARTARPVLT